jgi:hypothetical protein
LVVSRCGEGCWAEKIEMFVMSIPDSHQIDTPFDLWLAEQTIKYKELNTGGDNKDGETW